MCVTVAPVPVEPSPKLQPQLYGLVPPLAVAVKVIGWPVDGEVGLYVKLADSGDGPEPEPPTITTLASEWNSWFPAPSMKKNPCPLTVSPFVTHTFD